MFSFKVVIQFYIPITKYGTSSFPGSWPAFVIFLVLCNFIIIFENRVSLCIPGCPGT